VKTTIKAMKRIGEIKNRRERAFFKSRYVPPLSNSTLSIHRHGCRMAVSREKQRAHRKKVLDKAQKVSVELHKPLEAETSESRIRDKIKVSTRTALIQGEGRSMGMDID
jgi:large subunit ribosomal protein L24e